MRLSIITINYNNAIGLEKTINSIIGQTFCDFQYIVIDGDSTDSSKKILNNYSEKINTTISEPDTGIYHAMNKGISLAKGEYLLFLNSGDMLFEKNVLQNIIPHLGTADLLTGHTNMKYDNGYTITKARKDITFKTLFQYSIDHPSTFIKKEMFEKVGNYDESLKIVADWKWFLIAMAKHEASYKNIDQIVSTFDAGGISSLPENRAALLAERKKVLEREFPFFLKDYMEFIENEPYARNFLKLKNSRWVKIGRKLGLMKNIQF